MARTSLFPSLVVGVWVCGLRHECLWCAMHNMALRRQRHLLWCCVWWWCLGQVFSRQLACTTRGACG